MDANHQPRWIREFERHAILRKQIFLFGNVKDIALYFDDTEKAWTLGSLRKAAMNVLANRIGSYEVIGAYDMVDGMAFADQPERDGMSALFDEIVQQAERAAPPNKGRHPKPVPPQENLDQALHQMRLCLLNRQRACAFLVEYGSQLVGCPTSLSVDERRSFLRLLKAASESQMVGRTQNLLVMVCDKLTDLPPWLYLNNPFASSIEVESPRLGERRQFFQHFMCGQAAPTGVVPTGDITDGTMVTQNQAALEDLSDLTEGMAFRDLSNIRMLASRMGGAPWKPKELVDRYKYGDRESQWDSLDPRNLVAAEKALAARVMGQPAAVAAVADVLRRARLHLSGAQHSSRTKPRGVLFFAGPTGVGKTELAKAVAELVFGTEEALLRFDMSEYGQSHSDQRLLGAPPGYVGYEEGGQLTNRLKANPFSVLLFDEVEKAHPTILDKFLQILEDGRMTDGRGDTVYFSESIIVFTSNVGIYQIDQATGRPAVDPETGEPLLHVDPAVDREYDAVRAKVLNGVQSYFKHFLGRPELLNRIGQNIIVFDFVRELVMREILEKKVLRSIQAQIADRWRLSVSFAPAVQDQLMAICGSDVASGGRGIGNLAETAILNPLARVMFQILAENGEEALIGKTLEITGLKSPDESGTNRYEITWNDA